jgi:hypothetical protein
MTRDLVKDTETAGTEGTQGIYTNITKRSNHNPTWIMEAIKTIKWK